MTGGAETEIKLPYVSAEAARDALQRLGATLVRARHLEDNVLFDDARRSLMRRGELIRLRRTETGGVLTFKGPCEAAARVKSREEIESAVGEPDAVAAILGRLELRPTFRYQKYREVYQWRDAELVVDETPIGTFVEVEGRPETIHSAAKALGFAPEQYVTESYAALFFASGGTGDMLF